MIKERPIPFSRLMVRSILDDRKDQTRRIIKKLLRIGFITEFGKSTTPGYDWHFRDKHMSWHDLTHQELLDLCPKGKIGERLWVKERFAKIDDESGYGSSHIEYEASCRYPESIIFSNSMFMPRWASRILLEITNVRVERLQDISEEEAVAEGVNTDKSFPRSMRKSPRFFYEKLWQSINGPGAWDLNPWVWVIEFRKI